MAPHHPWRQEKIVLPISFPLHPVADGRTHPVGKPRGVLSYNLAVRGQGGVAETRVGSPSHQRQRAPFFGERGKETCGGRVRRHAGRVEGARAYRGCASRSVARSVSLVRVSLRSLGLVACAAPSARPLRAVASPPSGRPFVGAPLGCRFAPRALVFGAPPRFSSGGGRLWRCGGGRAAFRPRSLCAAPASRRPPPPFVSRIRRTSVSHCACRPVPRASPSSVRPSVVRRSVLASGRGAPPFAPFPSAGCFARRAPFAPLRSLPPSPHIRSKQRAPSTLPAWRRTRPPQVSFFFPLSPGRTLPLVARRPDPRLGDTALPPPRKIIA